MPIIVDFINLTFFNYVGPQFSELVHSGSKLNKLQSKVVGNLGAVVVLQGLGEKGRRISIYTKLRKPLAHTDTRQLLFFRRNSQASALLSPTAEDITSKSYLFPVSLCITSVQNRISKPLSPQPTWCGQASAVLEGPPTDM